MASAVARFAGSNYFLCDLILGLAPQALCCRLLRRLDAENCHFGRRDDKGPFTSQALMTDLFFAGLTHLIFAPGVGIFCGGAGESGAKFHQKRAGTMLAHVLL